jgi:hypothetical protein
MTQVLSYLSIQGRGGCPHWRVRVRVHSTKLGQGHAKKHVPLGPLTAAKILAFGTPYVCISYDSASQRVLSFGISLKTLDSPAHNRVVFFDSPSLPG